LPNYDGMFYRYLNAMIKNLVIDLDNPFVSAVALGSTPQVGIIALHKEFFRDRPDMPFPRTSTLVHEARHVELRLNGKPTSHIPCTKGVHAGTSDRLCDSEFVERWENASPHTYEIL